MRARNRLAPLGLAVVFSATLASAADEPAPLLKPVIPAGTNLRVRLPVTPGFPKVVSFPAQVPNGKKKSQLMDVVVAYDTLANPSYISAKKLVLLGYDPGKAKEFVLPELLVPAAQIAPKVAKEADVVVRFTNLKFIVVPETASMDDTIHFCDMSLSGSTLFQNREQALEPRLSFADKFLELTVPATTRRLGSDGFGVPEVTANGDAKLVAAVGPMTLREGRPGFTVASINGLDSYKTADGKIHPVNVSVASINNLPDGVRLSVGLARGMKVEMDPANTGKVGNDVVAKREFIPSKLNELRLGLLTGPGLKVQKELVIKDVPVYIDMNRTDPYFHIGQKFLDTYFVDAVYTYAGDGWKLHGRVNPELLFDPKPKIDPKQKVDPKAKIDPKPKQP